MGLGTIGSLIGSAAASGDQDKSQQALQDALNNLKGINTPSIEEQELALQQEQSAGKINPNLEQAVQQQGTGLANVSVNPQLRAAQMQALQSLQQQGQTGLTPQDKLALTQITQQNNQQANSANQAVLQNAAARGMGGSGASLAAQLANNQNSANNQQNQSLQVGAQGAQAALNATAQAGQLGSQMENNQYGEASNAARAQDVINQFNTANKQGVNAQNTLAQNQAQAYNLQNAQNIANTNTGIANQQQVANKGLYQQQYNNQLNQAQAEAGAENNLSGYYGNQAAGTRQEGAAIGNGIQQGLTSVFTGGLGGTGASGGQASGSSLASGGTGSGAAGSLGNLGQTQATQYGSANAGWSTGGVIPEAKPMHPIKLFKMLSPTGHNNMYADGGQVPMTTQQKLEAIQRGANALAAPQQQAPQFDPSKYAAPQFNNVEDAVENGQEQAANPNMAAQLAAFNAANGRPQAYAHGGLIDYPGIPQPHIMSMPQNYTSGGPVNGPEIVPGDSPKNDVVNAKLSGGELVIPKEINESNNDAVIMAFIKGAKTAGRR